MATSITKKNVKKSRKGGAKRNVNLAVSPNEETSISDFTPIHFTSKSLKLVPSNLTKAIEYLLYMKPALSRLGEGLTVSTSSSLVLRTSNVKNVNKSVITLAEGRKGFKGGDVLQAFGSTMGLGKKLITGAPLPRGTGQGPYAASLFRMRTDPWPEQKHISKTFKVTIKETPTLILRFCRSRAAIEGTERAAMIHEENEAYWNRVKTYKKMYNVEAQTPPRMLADRMLGMTKTLRTNSQIQVSYSNIYDCFAKLDDGGLRYFNSDEEEKETLQFDKKIAMLYDLDQSKLGDGYGDETDEFSEACKIVDIVESTNFMHSFVTLFRSIDRTVNFKKQMIFRKGVELDPLAKKCSITYDIEHLWTLRFLDVWGMPVTSLCVNPVNPNIVAVGHGMYFLDQPQHLGRVCIWNLKNCSHPEKTTDFRDGVTCVSFSRKHPFALLVSLISGGVKIVDISKPSLEVLVSCGGESTNEPIWQVQWFTFDSGNEEPVACGENGNVYLISKENFTKKIFVTICRREGVVKGIHLPQSCRKPMSVVSKPSVMCMAANPDNYYNYLVGSDDGCVHLCSTDYWHEHTDVFQAHIGPVYQIKYHPDCSKIFLTVGIDYCVRIWAQGVFQALVNLADGDCAIEDADWSPVNPNIVVTVASNRVSIWDISRLKLVSQGSIMSPTGSRFTSVKFTSNGSNLICGDVSGDVHVYALSNMPFQYINKGRVLKRTFRRLLLGKKDLSDKLRTVGYPFENLNESDL